MRIELGRMEQDAVLRAVVVDIERLKALKEIVVGDQAIRDLEERIGALQTVERKVRAAWVRVKA